MRKQLKFGSKINFQGKKFFVEEAGPRVLTVRRIFPDKPFGTLSPAITKIKTRDFLRKKK